VKLPAQISAVTFDVGGTLIQPWPSVGHIYAEAAVRHGVKNVSAELLNKRFAAAWSALNEFKHTRSDWARLVDETFRGLTDQPPSRTFFPELYERFAGVGAWRVFEDVLPTLDALASRGLKLGIISNWDERLRPLLRELRLHDCFDIIVVSCEAGCAKPSQRIFKAAAEKLGRPAQAILHVGDSLAHDAQGAIAAGMQALLLQRASKIAGADAINSLRELYSEPERTAPAR